MAKSRQRPPLSRRKKLVYTGLVLLITLAILYLLSIIIRSHHRYETTRLRPGWSGVSHVADEELGYRPVAGARLVQSVGTWGEITTWHNAEGFRMVPGTEADDPGKRPLILTLGCSYSYGYSTPAEKIYPELVAGKLEGRCVNASASGYGLAQMLIRARRLIPRLKPNYVLVQYSPWLPLRSMTHFSITCNIGLIPVPFFFREGDQVRVHSPVFLTKLHDLPFYDYRNREKSFGDFVSYLCRVGFPSFFYDDFHYAAYFVKNSVGMVPPTLQDKAAINLAAYGEIAQICRQHGARMLIVILGNGDSLEEENLAVPEGVVAVDTQKALLRAIPAMSAVEYIKAYHHLESVGGRVRRVDVHPNSRAHSVIAAAVLRGLEETKELDPAKQGK